MHVGITGTTLCGKSTLGRYLIQKTFKPTGRPILVLDPVDDPAWTRAGADFVTDDPQKFLRFVRANPEAVLFVDEARDFRENKACRDAIRKLATQYRHAGCNTHFLSHRYIDFEPAVRTCIGAAYLFASSAKNGAELADDFLCDEFRKCAELEKGEFIYKAKFGQCLRGSIAPMFGKI